jgi:hypothetical protein
MKAFMSDRTGRQERLSNHFALDLSAVHEVRAILETTEGATDVPAGHSHSPKPAWLWGPQERASALILAESLAAFLES